MHVIYPDLEAGSDGSRLDQAETRSSLTDTRIHPSLGISIVEEASNPEPPPCIPASAHETNKTSKPDRTKRDKVKNKDDYGVETTAYQPRGTNTCNAYYGHQNPDRPQIGNKGRFNPNLEAAPSSAGGQGREAGDEVLREANSCQPSLSDVASTYRSHKAEQRTLGDAINQKRSKGRFVCRHAP
ncbi:hypothetical protein ASPNIDRAFT_45173 [Aspergillus niger ATCC 1015]|uniref:Uncharacterized protein n=1 Tax=Aspergillus niger (strain ATCC 1015 / CBS 113.46 / FGSC A1144 / LSHB Ac4 / NCTC 3858a / NRRL 328 / USDA 3528.7) TaxID=380704 RepID=G3Y4M7_ASPNA|nr:hypothetical protein ASPNIDRAFT_45173 [Aspergillus niger ATCC 1015]